MLKTIEGNENADIPDSGDVLASDSSVHIVAPPVSQGVRDKSEAIAIPGSEAIGPPPTVFSVERMNSFMMKRLGRQIHY
jgi:hypothetical protein